MGSDYNVFAQYILLIIEISSQYYKQNSPETPRNEVYFTLFQENGFRFHRANKNNCFICDKPCFVIIGLSITTL